MTGLSKTKLIFYLAAIFVAGGITGAAIALKTSKQMLTEPPRPVRLETRYLRERFQAKLALTPEQSKVIEPILEKMSEDLKSIRQDTTKRISAIMKTAYEQIGNELTPDQRKKLEEMQKDRHDDRREPPHKKWQWKGPEPSRKSNSPPQKP